MILKTYIAKNKYGKYMKTNYKFKLNNKGNNKTGFLIALESNTDIPFEVKRIFYTYDVPKDNNRGNHAYYNTNQVLICLSGSIKVKCFNGKNENIYVLNKSDEALYIQSKVWRSTFEHSSDAVLLVLSSLEYNEEDYIRDYDEFLEVINCI